MPVLKHAKKKLRQDKKRTLRNKKVRTVFRGLVKKATTSPTAEAISAAYSEIDKAAKKNIIHKNKAAHMKSALGKLAGSSATAVTKAAPVKTKKAVKTKKVENLAAAKKASKKTDKRSHMK